MSREPRGQATVRAAAGEPIFCPCARPAVGPSRRGRSRLFHRASIRGKPAPMKVSSCLTVVLVSTVSMLACSEEDASGDKSPLSDAGTPGAGGAGTAADGAAASGGATSGGAPGTGGAAASGGAPAADAGPTLDCTADNWSGMSDACWSCICGACAEKLNVCNSDCTAILECSGEKGALVNVAEELPCEVSAVLAECVTTPAAQAQAGAILALDVCLIGGGPGAGSFRVCDTECAFPYPGDVCARYPQPDAGP